LARLPDFEKRLTELENRISKLEETKANDVEVNSNEIIEKIKKNFGKISAQNLIIISLKIKPKQTKQQLINLIETWGTPIEKWFQTTNFKARLLNKGLVIVIGKNENNEEVYSLSEVNGINFADELIIKYSS